MKILFLLKNKFFFFLLIIPMLSGIFSTTCLAQNFEHENLTWSEETTPYVLPDSLKDELAFYTKYHHYIEFNSLIEGVQQQLTVKHFRIYLNSDEAIEKNNKQYFPQNYGDGLNKLLIRVIQPNGEVSYIDETDIKKGVDEESGVEYSYYAIEGLQIGSEIETIVKTQRSPQFYGNQVYIQKSYPIYDYQFEYISPAYLQFSFKTYNSDDTFEEVYTDTINKHTLTLPQIEKYEEEPMSCKSAGIQYLVYKLDKNLSRDSQDINGYGYYSQIIGERALNFEPSKGEIKKLKKLVKDLDIMDTDSNKEKVLKVEHYIKENFTHIESHNEASLEDFNTIIDKKAFNDFGSIKLYKSLLQQAGIDIQVIYTCENSEIKFDEDFESYVFLGKMLLYVDKIKMALDPSDGFSRLMYFDPEYQGHKGLFIKSRNVGGLLTATGKIKTIPTTQAMENLHKAKIDVIIEDEFDDLKIIVEKEATGLVAKSFQPMFSLIDGDLKEEFYKYAMYTYADQLIYPTLSYENIEARSFPELPLIAKCELSNEEFLQKGGDTYILNVGALIGPQSQMYNEGDDVRKTEIHSYFARAYQYSINFNIPEGYNAINLEKLNIDISGGMNDNKYYFKSDYTQEGNQISITVEELYNKAIYPAEEFSAYKNVINAAADFNKLKIIFKPQ